MYISAYFGSVAWQARRDKGWTQEEVAERVGISTRWYQQIECGVVNATFAVCVRIARVLGLDLNQFWHPGWHLTDRAEPGNFFCAYMCCDTTQNTTQKRKA